MKRHNKREIPAKGGISRRILRKIQLAGDEERTVEPGMLVRKYFDLLVKEKGGTNDKHEIIVNQDP